MYCRFFRASKINERLLLDIGKGLFFFLLTFIGINNSLSLTTVGAVDIQVESNFAFVSRVHEGENIGLDSLGGVVFVHIDGEYDGLKELVVQSVKNSFILRKLASNARKNSIS